jgi:branched-chain amino acid transport system substrate-binding protein
MRLAYLAVLAMMTLALASGGGVANGQAKPPIVLGVLAGLTGGMSTISVPYVDAAKFAADEINQKGGINGRKVTLVIQDNESQAVAGVQAALKLVDVDKVNVLLCSCWSIIIFPLSDALANKNMVVINGGSTTPEVRKRPGYLVSPIGTDDILGGELAKFVYGLGFHRAAILTVNDPYGTAFQQVVRENFRKLGGEISTELVVDSNLSDYRADLKHVVDAKSDAVFVGTFANDLRLQFRQLTELGWKGMAFNLYPTATDLTKDPGADGHVIGTEPTWLENDPAGKAWAARFRQATGKEPSFWHAVGYDATWLGALGVGNAKDSSAQSIREAIRNFSTTYSGPTGPMKFDSEFVRANPNLAFLKLMNGKYVRVDKQGKPL